MNKKILISIGIIALEVVLLSGCMQKPKTTTTITVATTMPSKTTDLSRVRVASQYRYVTDGGVINRDLDDVMQIFRETRTDFIFQGWLTQRPCSERCSDLSPEKERSKCELVGYSYEHLRNAVSEIKKEMQEVIFCGGVQAEYFFPDEVSGRDERERRDKAWEMVLDPGKWDINFSKRDMQCYWAKRWGIVGKKEECPGEEELKWNMRHYFPDLTNPEFQEIFLNRICKQIDSGADAVWIDMLYAQAALLRELTGDENHPAVQESYDAASGIVDRIHEYGNSRGKHIYVITWVAIERRGSIVLLHPDPNVDAAMTSPSPDEILDGRGRIGEFNEQSWDEIADIVKGFDMHIFARIDYGGIGRSPLRVFSQELTPEQQGEFLIKADEFFQKKGIIFIYPIHGGDMGQPASEVKKLSYGKFNWYDSLAPEFQTYDTIKELAQDKKSK